MSGEVNAIIAQIAARGVRWAAGEITKLRAENAALLAKLAAEEWRPIEEAPKNRTVVMGYPIGGDNAVWPIYSDTEFWYSLEDGETVYPTHYRPLPQPPEVM